jgi:ribonuclease P protein component
VIYSFADFEGEIPAKVAFSAPKRFYKSAAERNYIKRRMREAFRQLKPDIYSWLAEQNKKLLIVFVCQQFVENITTAELKEVISKAVARLKNG